MNRLVFDTETTDLNNCFCYDTGYVIIDEQGIIQIQKHFVVEQIWHNLELFKSAYYADKREKYVKLMRARKATMEKWGYITQEMIRDIKKYDVTDAYAYNSNFDEKVFNFNCDWFKTQNPFDNVAIHDIWGYASQIITNTDAYKEFCEENARFTDSGNYSGTAETVFQYLTNNPNFVEEHMGLYDAQIEAEILQNCIDLGLKYDKDYDVVKVLNRPITTPYKVTVNGIVIHEGEYIKKMIYKNNYKFTEPCAKT